MAKIYGADFDAVFFPGSHGAVWDLSENADSQRLIETFVAEGRPLAAGCHAPAILKHTKSADGIPLVSIRRVTEFNNPEEAGFGLTFAVPFVIAGLLFAPVVNPWYLLWLTPWVALQPRPWTITALAAVTLAYCTAQNLGLPHLAAFQHRWWGRPTEVALAALAAHLRRGAASR